MEKIINDALKDKKSILKQIDKDFKEGYAKGMREGFKRGKEKVMKEAMAYCFENLPYAYTKCDYDDKLGVIKTKEITSTDLIKGLISKIM